MLLSKYYNESKIKNKDTFLFKRTTYNKDFFKNINNTCNNCGNRGHVFKSCSKPIISYGIICYKENLNDISYLLVQRKSSIGYTDFLRGKYNYYNKESMINIYIEEMTNEERNNLLKYSFEELWDNLWIDVNSRCYKNDFIEAKKKFDKLDLHSILDNSPASKYTKEEFGFPKGRPNSSESKLQSSIREFQEETSYNKNEIEFIKNKKGENVSYDETFLGSNGVYYKHIYFLAKLNTDRKPIIDPYNIHQAGEIKSIVFYNYKDSMNCFRDYDSEKRNILYQVNKLITNN